MGIFLIMLFMHIVDDYYLQGILAKMKQRSWWEENAPQEKYKHDYKVALFMHAFSWTFMIMLPLLIVYGFQYNVFVNAVNFKAEAEGETSAIYFGDMPEGEYIKNMRVSNVCTENASHLAVASQSVDMVIEKVRNENLLCEAVKIVTGSEESVHIEVK